MSIASPQSREEFKKHILTKLGAPVLQINVADEQLDIAINDAFQYYNERSHFYGTERMYLTFLITREFRAFWKGYKIKDATIEPDKSLLGDSSDNLFSDASDEDGGSQDILTDDGSANIPMTARYQNNFLVMPDDVVGVTDIMRSSFGSGMIGGTLPIGPGNILAGNLLGDSCDNTFTMTTYWVMRGYLAMMDFMFNPPIKYNFNQRTHRLHIDSDLGFAGVGTYLCVECMVKPSPDIFPDLWNDMWLKEFATALVKSQWGRNLIKYNQVSLPGGITLNGDRILSDAQKELETIKQRFAMDWSDPPLDMVG